MTQVSCLTSATPSGLKSLREKELAILRGEGVSDKPREKKDRIYDYDVYNDLGDSDKDPNLARPVLGNKDYPHPRRCKTSRPPTKSDPLPESQSSDVYVPRDEAFSEVKNLTFNVKTIVSHPGHLHRLIRDPKSTLNRQHRFPPRIAFSSITPSLTHRRNSRGSPEEKMHRPLSDEFLSDDNLESQWLDC
ncbi:hypothetical protein L1987_01172 [Smallanthus sonchifolius]|uniref:Uncharacterized protein n=1 Tax=Smallanthus sonchifolius TaxID=185202 RepID=A0ACB9K4D8_9ASTR|nr:hypothetical protein L1987_01172 [Smallanthus sonchifolius]